MHTFKNTDANTDSKTHQTTQNFINTLKDAHVNKETHFHTYIHFKTISYKHIHPQHTHTFFRGHTHIHTHLQITYLFQNRTISLNLFFCTHITEKNKQINTILTSSLVCTSSLQQHVLIQTWSQIIFNKNVACTIHETKLRLTIINWMAFYHMPVLNEPIIQVNLSVTNSMFSVIYVEECFFNF